MAKIIRESLDLGTVSGFAARQKVLVALFNHYHLSAFALVGNAWASDYQYSIRTEDRLNQQKLAEVRAFVAGIIEGMR